MGDYVTLPVSKRERVLLQRGRVRWEARAQQYMFTCLDDLQGAVALWVDVVDGVQAGAVVVVKAGPLAVEARLDA